LETMLLDRNEYRIMEKFGQRNRLVMTSLKEKDFGNYTCQAENDLGKASGTIELSGKPNEPLVISSAQGMYSDEYNITWTLESYSPIKKFRLMYRKFISESDPYSDARSRWINYILDMERDTSYHQSDSFRHEKSYQFFALEPNTRYEVMVQAENVHGWGKYSELFIFSTRAPADVPVELPVESLAGSGVTSQTITLVGGATNLGVGTTLLFTQMLLLLS